MDRGNRCFVAVRWCEGEVGGSTGVAYIDIVGWGVAGSGGWRAGTGERVMMRGRHGGSVRSGGRRGGGWLAVAAGWGGGGGGGGGWRVLMWWGGVWRGREEGGGGQAKG